MAKGQQRSNKEAKKPKKDQSTGKPPPAPLTSVKTTIVPDRSKKK